MKFNKKENDLEEYPVEYYIEFLKYIKTKYDGDYFHLLPGDMASF